MIDSNKEMEYTIKLLMSLEYSGILVKSATKAIEDKEKDQKRWTSFMFLDIVGINLLQNMLKGLTRKGVI